MLAACQHLGGGIIDGEVRVAHHHKLFIDRKEVFRLHDGAGDRLREAIAHANANHTVLHPLHHAVGGKIMPVKPQQHPHHAQNQNQDDLIDPPWDFMRALLLFPALGAPFRNLFRMAVVFCHVDLARGEAFSLAHTGPSP